jgi:hypothetical protein
MAADPLDALRLALMQDVLPVGLAVVERVRRGGPAEVIAALNSDEGDPLDRLRQEGEPAARQVRDNLDRVQPGLGNPVVKVSVRDVPGSPPANDAPAQAPDPEDPAALQQALERISGRLTLLESRLLPARGPADPEGGRVS